MLVLQCSLKYTSNGVGNIVWVNNNEGEEIKIWLDQMLMKYPVWILFLVNPRFYIYLPEFEYA